MRQYESVALVFRVIPHEAGIALRVRGKVRFYETDSLEESPPIPLRPIRDGPICRPSMLRCSGTAARGEAAGFARQW